MGRGNIEQIRIGFSCNETSIETNLETCNTVIFIVFIVFINLVRLILAPLVRPLTVQIVLGSARRPTPFSGVRLQLGTASDLARFEIVFCSRFVGGFATVITKESRIGSRCLHALDDRLLFV